MKWAFIGLTIVLAGCQSNPPAIEFETEAARADFSERRVDLINEAVPLETLRATPRKTETLSVLLNPNLDTWPVALRAEMGGSRALRSAWPANRAEITRLYSESVGQLLAAVPSADSGAPAEPVFGGPFSDFRGEPNQLLGNPSTLLRLRTELVNEPLVLREAFSNEVDMSQEVSRQAGLILPEDLQSAASLQQMLNERELVLLDFDGELSILTEDEWFMVQRDLESSQAQRIERQWSQRMQGLRAKALEYASLTQSLYNSTPAKFMSGVQALLRQPSLHPSLIDFESRLVAAFDEAGWPLKSESRLNYAQLDSYISETYGLQTVYEIDPCVGDRGAAFTRRIELSHRKPAEILESINGLVESLGIATTEFEGCASFALSTDQASVLVRGTDFETKTVEQLIRGVDLPGLQVLVEAFLVQVDTNWRRKLEVTLSGMVDTGDLGGLIEPGTLALARGILNSEDTFTFGSEGSSADTQAVNNLVQIFELNKIGRTISSPTILATDGIEATISRTRTIRYQGPSTQTTSSTNPPVTTVTPGDIEEIEAPLELKIKPEINMETRHVVLDFSFVETTYDVANPNELSSSLTNEISTRIETAPGEIAVLAGLYKESNSRETLGLPGTTRIPLLAGLFGGRDDLQSAQSDLLVFIAPTVIQPQISVRETQP